MEFIRQNQSAVEDTLESDDGLAEYLFSKNVLTYEQYDRIRKGSNWESYIEQNRELLSAIVSDDDAVLFTEALLGTNQRHVANFIHGLKGLTMITNDLFK